MSLDPHDGPPTVPAGAGSVRTESGLEYVDIAPGAGEPVRLGDRIRIRYRTWLTDGGFLAGTGEGDEPYEFVLGSEEVVAGWNEGIPGMLPGGRRRLIIPADLAYGADGREGVVPPYSTLICDIELIGPAR
jgi:FKBP-type peptidyl-prolyl cis-trans isomerase